MSASVHSERTARRTGAIDAVIASLPVSLRPAADGENADLVAVNGAPGWPARLVALLEAGARGAVVVDPVGEDAPSIEALVVVDRTYASHPAVADAIEAAVSMPTDALLEVRIDAPVDRADDRALLDALALARTFTGSRIETGRVLFRTRLALSARVRFANGRTGILTVLRTGARPASALVRVLSPAVALVATLPHPGTARPASVVITTQAGETRSPARFESAHRHSWRRLLDSTAGLTDLTDADADTRALRLLLDPS